MYADSRSVPKGTVFDTEICIVGAGAAGITLALELANMPFRVTVVESGGFDFDDRTHRLLKLINIGRPYPNLESSRLRYFGGTTNHWGGQCVPLGTMALERRSWIPNSGWPISRKHLDPFYMRAHKLLGIGEFDYDAKRLATIVDKEMFPFSPEKLQTVISRYNAVKFGSEFRDDLGRAGNITTYLRGNVVNVNRHEYNAHVKSVSVKTLSGAEFTVSARYFVLALGGIENARILLLSNDVENKGLGNQYDLVGRYFMEHIWYPSGLIIPTDQDRKFNLYNSELPTEQGYALRGHLTLSEHLQRRFEIPEFRSEIKITRSSKYSDAVASARSIRDNVAEYEWPTDLGKHLLNVVTGLEDIANHFIGEDDPIAYQLNNYVEQVPNPDSRIDLARERDELGLNRATIDWRLSALDKIGIRKSQEVIAAEVGQSGFGRMRIELVDDEDVLLDGAHGGNHHMGTTRMDANARRGVTNADCRAHGLHNLFIAGSSVFPTGGYANPTLTIVALAIRLADHLKSLMAR